MNRIDQFLKRLQPVILCIGLGFSSCVFAQPIVVEGAVPNDASKQAILTRLRAVYGQDQVVDKIQIRAVSAPNGWSDSVTRVITPDLKKVSQGKLTVRGIQVNLSGKMGNQAEIQPLTDVFQSMVQPPYRLNAELSVNQAEQAVVDNALKNRIIEFESGSAILTPAGTRILDEMVVALNKVQGNNVRIIGHTDSSGDPQKNAILSQQRADAVKQYLVGKGIVATRLATAGSGSQKPVADNTTAEGRKKNRRIEFEVL
ncbi:OmpA family protein [Acinetobacter sp. WZC-1]|uniref:OmpA family protein n=1 Tax=Acinetobacter sp. WZC-1 TaxID=3459034 RepID=UPI00403DF0D0